MTNTDRRHDEEDIQRMARELQRPTAEEFARMVRLLRPSPTARSSARPSSRSATSATRSPPRSSRPRSTPVKKGLPGLQHELPGLPRAGQVPGLPRQDARRPDGPDRGATPLLPLPHCRSGHYPGDDALGLEHPRLTAGARAWSSPGRDHRQLRRGGRDAPARGGRAPARRIDRRAGHRGRRRAARAGPGRRPHPRARLRAAWDWQPRRRRRAGRLRQRRRHRRRHPGARRRPGPRAGWPTSAWSTTPEAFDPEAPADARPIERARYLAGLHDLDELGGPTAPPGRAGRHGPRPSGGSA